MGFEDVYLVSKNLELADPTEITALADKLQIKLPNGYFEFMTTLGFGDYCYNLVVYPPQKILSEYLSAQQTWEEYYLWEEGEEVLPKEEVVNSIIFGHSFDGDYLIYSPSRPEQLFVLPRHSQTIYTVPSSFFDPLNWYYSNGDQVYPAIPFKFFTPYRNRGYVTFSSGGATVELQKVIQTLTQGIDNSKIHQFEPDENLIMLFLEPFAVQVHIRFSNEQIKNVRYIRIEYDLNYRDKITSIGEELAKLNFTISEQKAS